MKKFFKMFSGTKTEKKVEIDNEYTPPVWKGCHFWDRINFELYAEIKRTRK
jgi:hypothetical protein